MVTEDITVEKSFAAFKTRHFGTYHLAHIDKKISEVAEVESTSTEMESGPSNGSISINSGDSYTSSANVGLQLSAQNATEMYITNEPGCISGGSWEAYAPTKSWALGANNATVSIHVMFKSETDVNSTCISANIVHDDEAPTVPAAFDDGARGSDSSLSPVLGWGASVDENLSHYEVAIGTTFGTTDILDWTNIGAVTSHSVSGLSLVSGQIYFVSIKAVDMVGNESNVANGDGFQQLECPVNFIKVPGNDTTDLGGSFYSAGTQTAFDWTLGSSKTRDLSDFCVMKYEAKNVGSIATSQTSGTPWVSITRNEARTECSDLGDDYYLIANNHWQAIARNIENVTSNWSEGTSLGSSANTLNRGHTDNSPATALSASTDSDSCSGTGQACSLNVWDEQRRTHTLSNGEVLWDLSGNVAEWLADDRDFLADGTDSNSDGYGASGNTNTDPFSDEVLSANQLMFGPSADHSTKAGGGGLGYFNDGTSGGLVRGGDRNGSVSGIFWAALNLSPVASGSGIGFRCVYAPSARKYIVVEGSSNSIAQDVVGQAIKLQLTKADGSDDAVSGVSISLSSVKGSGALGGTTSGWVSDSNGEVIINGWTWNVAEALAVEVQASGYSSTAVVHFDVRNDYVHNCSTNDATFATADGGCKDLATGLSWSDSGTPRPWYQTIWGGSNVPAGNEAPDADDGVRLNDYDPSYPVGSSPDNHLSDYCHSLVEGGQSDWRVPTLLELQTVSTNGLSSYFQLTNGGYLQSSSTYQANQSRVWCVHSAAGSTAHYAKTDSVKVPLCVRGN